MASRPTEPDLPVLLRSEEPALSAERVADLRKRLEYLGRKAGVRHEDVPDLVQDVLETAVRQLQNNRFRRESSMATWMAGILRHKIADYFDKRHRDPLALIAPAPVTPASGEWWHPALFPKQEVGVIVQHALEQLPVLHRTVLVLNIVEGLTTNEIAHRLGMNPKTLGKILWRAKPMLARVLGGRRAQERVEEGSDL